MIGWRNRNVWLGLALLINGWTVRGDEPSPAVFPAESKAAGARIDAIRKLLADQKYSAAVEEIQGVLTASGDDLVAVGPERCVSCRRLCQAFLASLPADALRSYRDNADPAAKKWLDQAVAGRDVRLLRQVVDEAFCSRPGEKALDLLGDFAFERGDFAEAEQWWGLLLPPSSTNAAKTPLFILHYPDALAAPARTRAKILLARLFRGVPPTLPSLPAGEGRVGGWDDDLEAYRKDYGAAEGTLAGRNGRYADILRQVRDERQTETESPTADWPTFGGDPSRGLVLSAPPHLLERLGALCRPGNERRFSLKDRGPEEMDPVYDRGAGPMLANRSMAFEPVVADGKAIVADARYVTAYDLRTGAVETWYDAARLNGGVHPDLKLPAPPDLRYTLTAAGDRLFVRLGTQSVRDAPAVDKDRVRDDQSLLVCLSLKPTRTGDRFLWSIDASAPENAGKDRADAVFEGSPLVHDGRLYIASTRFRNGLPTTRIHCYPADAAEEPAELWHQDICETHEFADKERRYRRHLLTLAGSYLVYCSRSGVIAALDAVTGKPAWSVRYPSRGDKTADNDPSPRDLAPCLFADGRLYVAPADYDRLLCLDPATGETVWVRGPLEAVHLLGVGEGRLIFTTPTGLRAVTAGDGVDVWALPDGGGALAPAGRGLLIGDLVLWPTASKGPNAFAVYAVRQSDGRQPDDPSLLSRIPAGNLVYADGCLLSADRQALTIFTPPALQLPKKEPSRIEKHLGLLDAARRAAAAKRWDETSDYFRRASSADFPAPLRLQTLLDEAALWVREGHSDRALAVWQGLQSEAAFHDLMVEDETGVPRSVAAFAAARLGQAAKPNAPAAEAPKQPAALHPPLLRTWQTTLGAGETPLCVADGDLLCRLDQPEAQTRGELKPSLALRAGETGKTRWRASLSFSPTWTARNGSVILAAGEEGAAGLRSDDGQIAWTFAAPPPSRTFPDEAGMVLTPGAGRADPLGNFYLFGDRLYCIQGERRILVLDAENGRVLWARRAAGGGLRQPYPDGRFFHVVPTAAGLLVQTANGRRWLLDAATGRLLHDDPTAREPWPRDPTPLPDGGVLLTTDARTVVLLDPASDQEIWTYTLPGETTRTGEAPRLSAEQNALLLAWPTNNGWRIQRLDRSSGRPMWAEPPLLNVDDLDINSWVLGADAFYGVQDRVLFARSLKDGAELWRQPLAGPKGPWRTLRVSDALFAYPLPSRGLHFQFRWLFGRLQWEGSLPLGEEAERGFPLVCYDVPTGRLVERLNFPVVPQSFFRLDPDEADVFLSLTISPAAGRPLVGLSAKGLVVALAGRAWGLSAK